MTVLVAVTAAGFVVAAVAVGSGSWQASPVLSGSMEPKLRTGGLAVTQRVPVADLAVGDVVLFQRPDERGKRVVHRIVELTRSDQGMVLRTKGDANSAVDPWRLRASGDAWVARAAVPYLGSVEETARSLNWQVWLTAAGGVVLLGAGLKLLRSDDPAGEPASAA